MIVLGRPTAQHPPATEPVATVNQPWSRDWIYFAFLVVAWFFTPLVRRLIDYHNGAFNPVQVASLIPYVVLIPLVFVCFQKERLARVSSTFKLLTYLWTGAFVYGLLLAFANENLSAGGFEFVEYMLPMLAGIWLAGQSLPADRAFRRVAAIILPCSGIVAIYGLFQWINPPPWDVMWVVGNDFQTVGSPTPFAMRVFSSLNSPGTAGDFFALTMLLVLPWLRIKNVWLWPLLGALGASLLLTLVREAWVGLVFGGFVYLMVSPRRAATAPLVGLYALLMVVIAVSLPPLLGSRNADVITQRVSTLGDVSHDTSALDRQAEIADALDQGFSHPVGSGLGVFGSASKLGANPTETVGTILDSGYLARLIELGWLGTIAYVIVVLAGPVMLTYKLFKKDSPASVDIKVTAALILAICAALGWGDAADDAHYGLDGFYFWIALGLGSLAQQSIAGVAPALPAVRNRFMRFVR